MVEKDVDVAIIGGGMVGASLAVALARACPELSITVLEAVDMPDTGAEAGFQPSYDMRSTALSYGTRLIYEQLGLWDLLREHVTPIERIHVSDRGQFGAARLQARDYRLEALGYVTPNQWMGRVLWAGLKQYGNIQFRCPVQVRRVQHEPQGVLLELAETGATETVQRTLRAQLAILADGGRSGLRQQLGIQTEKRSYGQVALITNVSSRKHHEFVAYERFTDQGPMALLPLGAGNLEDHRSVLIWTLPEDRAQEVLEACDEQFLEMLGDRFGHRLGGFAQVGSRHVYPLALERALEQVRPGLVLVGNAAHSLHPVAGQGYNLAVREVMGLAELLAKAHRAGQWLGDLSLLSRYEQDQQEDQLRTIVASDSLVRLFSNAKFPLTQARGAGLITLDLVAPLKQTFARYAMGLGGREAVLA